MQKIEISFNDAEYQKAFKDLQLNLRKFEQCLESTQRILGVRELKPLEEIERAITERTGFQNLIASAELINVLQELVYLQNHLHTIELDKIEKEGNTWQIKDSVLKQLKNACTEYLDECFVDDFNLLSKAAVHLNKLSLPSLSNCLKRDYTGQWSINLVALQNSKIML